MTRSLLRLKTDVPLDFDWDQWHIQDYDSPRLQTLFREWGFRGFAEQVRGAAEKPAPVKEARKEPKGEQGGLFDQEEDDSAQPQAAD